jgi:hypothetical protein
MEFHYVRSEVLTVLKILMSMLVFRVVMLCGLVGLLMLCNNFMSHLQGQQWRHYVPLKCWHLLTCPHGVTTQKTNIDMEYDYLGTSEIVQVWVSRLCKQVATEIKYDISPCWGVAKGVLRVGAVVVVLVGVGAAAAAVVVIVLTLGPFSLSSINLTSWSQEKQESVPCSSLFNQYVHSSQCL